MCGGSVLIHALLVHYNTHGVTATAPPYYRRFQPAVPFSDFRKSRRTTQSGQRALSNLLAGFMPLWGKPTGGS